MKKAFFINGGAGRVLCAIPALEHYVTHTDPTAVIVVEGWLDLYLTSKILAGNVWPANDPNIFEQVKDREIISPEPYQLNAYFNQKCNLVQAFDMLINYDTPPKKIPETKQFKTFIGKNDMIGGHSLCQEAKSHFKKDKVVVLQPFGSTATLKGNTILDESGRSFELDDLLNIIEQLNKNYAVILMSEFKIPIDRPMGIMHPEDVSLLQWTGIINAADYFLGCDSVGQHIAHSLNKPGAVVMGSTFPENTSHPADSSITIIDNGKDERIYSPIRIVVDVRIDRHNENLMKLTNDTMTQIIEGVNNSLEATQQFTMITEEK